jgi:hypothetical protein
MNFTVKADAATLKAAAEIYTSALEPIKPVEGLVCSLTLQPYPVSLLRSSAEKGGNALGLSPDDGPLVSVLLLTYWKLQTDDEKVIGTMRRTLESIEEDSTKRGTAVGYKLMQYCLNFQDPIASYGAENKAMLQEVSKKFDPEGVFQKAVPGGWKLFS